jgi:hypothetical protein
MSIWTSIVSGASKVAVAVKPHIPTIALVAGSASVVGGAFLACKATLEVDKVLSEHQAEMNRLKKNAKTLIEAGDPKYDTNAFKRDKLRVYAATTGKIVRLYGPSVGLEAAGFASIFYGFGLIKTWHAAAVQAFTAVDNKFAKYRNNVVETYGADADKQMLGELHGTTTVPLTNTDENGEPYDTTVDVVGIDALEDDFTFIFDWRSPKWENGYLFNDLKIVEVQDWYTKHLRAGKTHYFMNKVGEEFGRPTDGVGHFYGWTNKPGARVFFSAQPFIRIFNADDDGQFPMIVTPAVSYDEEGRYFFINEDDEKLWKDTYTNNEKNVGYILHFNVDTDDSGVPHNIYEEVYGNAA